MRVLAWCGLASLALGCGEDPGTDTAPSGSEVPGNLELTTFGAVECAQPGARDAVRFDRRASPTAHNSQIWVWAGGIVAADFDDDGDIDLFTPTEGVAKMYWGSPAGSFVEEVMTDFDLSFGIGGTAVDYDGDEDLDLYVTRYSRPNVLLRNDGPGVWVDVTKDARADCLIPDGQGGYEPGMSMASTWADYDRDGDLDLFVGNYGWVDHSLPSAALMDPSEPSCLLVNNGDGTLTDVTADLLPYERFYPLHDGYIYVAAWQDMNGDGYPELYTINDFGTAYPNRLLWNHAGTLDHDEGPPDCAEAIKLPDGRCLNEHGLDLPMTGMGLGINDLNGDLLPDLLVPIWNGIRLMESYRPPVDGAEPVWTDIPGAKGIRVDSGINQKVGWGAELQDMDNDADLDAVVAYGFVDDLGNPIWDNPFGQPDGLYVNEGGTFTDQAALWGTDDRGIGRGFAVVDLNRDGWLDIAKRDLNGPNVFYVSHCGDEAWLTLELRDPSSMNTRAIGAKIVVTEGDTTQVRWVRAGGTGHAFGGPPEVHFGLGDADGAIDRVEITWPDGETSVIEQVEARQHLLVRRTGA